VTRFDAASTTRREVERVDDLTLQVDKKIDPELVQGLATA
jgi:hypothetical protein